MDSRVLQTQKWLNTTYGKINGFPSVDEDGITGNSTFRALIYALQLEIGIENPDGIFRRAISGLAKNSYGIYLVQYF